MKAFTQISLVAVALAAAVPFLQAAEKSDAAAAAPAHHRRHPALSAHLAGRLNLTAEQRTALKTDRAKTAAALKAIRGDASLTPEQKRAKARETLQAARQTARNTLTAEQQAKLQKMRHNLKHRLGRG